jgi:hypothetical protein
MKRIFVSLAALTLLTAAALPASASVLYGQPLDSGLTGRESSETATGALGFANQAFDNFSLTTTGTVNEVSWTGFLSPGFTSIHDFTISFYEDDFNNVGTGAIGTPIIGASTTITGTANQSPDTIQPDPSNGFELFDFSAAIDPFVANANTTYWISIVANPDLGSGDFYWAFSNKGDGMFEVSNNGGVGIINTDLAFTLSNTAVPEPSGLMLDGSGLLVLAGFGRRLLARSGRT